MPGKKKTPNKKGTMLHLEKTVDLPNLQSVEKQNEDLRKEVATLKLKLFQSEQGKPQLEEANQNPESDLATINYQQVKLREKVTASTFLKHQAGDESAKLRHLMAVGDSHQQIELKEGLKKAKKLEVALAAPKSIQMSAPICFTPDQTKMVQLQYDIVKEKEKVQAVTKLWHEERASLLSQLEAARTHAVAQQQKAEEDLVKEQRRCQELETTIQILENSKQVLAKENEQLARQEWLAKQEQRQEQLGRQEHLEKREQIARQEQLARQEQEQLANLEQLARQELQHEEKQKLEAAVISAERMLQSSTVDWRGEKDALICLVERSRDALDENEKAHLAMESSLSLELEKEKDSHTKTMTNYIQALEDRLASEASLNTKIEELRSEIATRQNRKWYQRLLSCCR